MPVNRIEKLPLRGCLFDKDGTLIDHHKSFGPATKQVIREFSNDDSKLAAKLAEAVDFDLEKLTFGPNSPIIAADPNDHAALWAPVLDIPFSQALTDKLDASYARAIAQSISAFDGLSTMMDVLSDMGLQIGLATNDAERNARQQLELIGVIDHFSFIAGYNSGFGSKPLPGMPLAFADYIGCSTAQILMIGDTLTDIEAGKRAGAVTVAIASGTEEKELLSSSADYILDGIADLPDLIQNIT